MKEYQKILIKKFQSASDEMMWSLKFADLDKLEKNEWYGYIRAVRDCAYDAGILQETTIQQNLEDATKLLQSSADTLQD